MKSRFFSMLICTVLLFSCLTGCEGGKKEVMNTETSRLVMDELINSDNYAIRVIYDGMDLEFFYEKCNGKEFLSTTVSNTQSAIMRANGYTYYIDVIGSKEVRCIPDDTTELNYAIELLNMIYKQTVVDGKLTMTKELKNESYSATVDNYVYEDTENDVSITWTIFVSDNKIIKAARSTDGNSFTFEYPKVSESVFYIPDDYNIVGGPRPDFS